MADTTLATPEETKKKWHYGINRWFVLLFIILSVFGARAISPVLPHIQLPAERYSHIPLFTLPVIGEFYWTNTLTATVLVDLVLLILALIIRGAVKSGKEVLDGFAGTVEALIEVLYNLTESTAGRFAKTIFPYFATITFMVLVANWMELIPGVDSIGILEQSDHGYPIEPVLGFVNTIVKTTAEGHGDATFTLIPFVRVVTTDLNFTLGLALISVVMTQVIGVRARGTKYFGKFINVKTLFSKPVFGVIDFGVGILETVSEFSKILSFSFRLFGNIFAGSVLLFVIGSLVPVFAQSIFLMLEFFIGLIQALVFGMLTMVFMSQATHGH